LAFLIGGVDRDVDAGVSGRAESADAGEAFAPTAQPYRVYRTQEVALRAEALGIEMIFIARRAAGRYQPLDRRTFWGIEIEREAKW
jgi:hypothetical protein